MKKLNPVVIQKLNSNPLRVSASIPIDALVRNRESVRVISELISILYTDMISSIDIIYSMISEMKKKDPRCFWLIGSRINDFYKHLSNVGFYLVNPNDTIARDCSLSASSIKKIALFSKRFKAINLINPKIPWEKYRSNRVSSEDLPQQATTE